MKLLTAKQHLVFNLVRIQGRQQNDVAKTLNMGKSAVSRLLSRAEERLESLTRSCGSGMDCGLLKLLSK